MPGLFDILSGALGRPDPSMAIAQRLGQAPGQVGSPQGPMPGGTPAPAAGGAAPSSAGGAAPAGPQQPPQAPPQPQVYQSPPDLAQMYMALSQHEQARQQFNSGLGLLAASAYPGRRPDIIMKAMSGMGGEDAGSMFSNLMQLQQFQQQQQNLAAYRQNLPAMVKAAGLPDSFVPLAMADPTLLSKIAETKAGVGGDAVTQELNRSISNWKSQNPGKSDSDMLAAHPEYAGPIEFQAAKQGEVAASQATAKDLIDDRHSFQDANADYGQTEQMLGWLKDHPDATAAAVHAGSFATGRTGQAAQALGALPPDTATAAGYLAQLQGKLYSSSWKGRGGRLSQLEAGKISEGFSQLNNPALPDDQINGQIGRLYDTTRAAHANSYGRAGMPAPSDMYSLMDDQFKKGGKLFAGTSEITTPSGGGSSAAPASSSSSSGGLKPMPDATKAAAQALISKDPNQRGPLMDHLRQQGLDPTGL